MATDGTPRAPSARRCRFPICNRDPSTAPRLGGRVFPLCWRCCGVALGIATGSLAVRLLGVSAPWPLAVAAGLLLAVDYRLRRRGPARNLRRLLTGWAFGTCSTGALLAVAWW